jgi:hypothetical protein
VDAASVSARYYSVLLAEMTAQTTLLLDRDKGSFLALIYPYDDGDGATCLVRIRYLDRGIIGLWSGPNR